MLRKSQSNPDQVDYHNTMKNIERYVDLYTDYLIASEGQTTATELSRVLNKEVSHDKFTRMLKEGAFGSEYLWRKVKPFVRQVQSNEGILIFDDVIVTKEWTDENEIVCWHYDHSKGRNVKGINILNMLYHVEEISLPVGFEVVRKPNEFRDERGRKKRKAQQTKNELMRQLFLVALHNQIPFRYVVIDSWFASKENFVFIRKHQKHPELR